MTTAQKVLAAICLVLALLVGREIQGRWEQWQALNSLHCPYPDHSIMGPGSMGPICGESATITVGGQP